MRYVEVDGLRLSAIGLGTWQFGSREWGYGETYATEAAPAIVRRAIELGVTLIDTAEMYGFGRSERIVGGAIEGRRDEVVLATKLLPILPVQPVVDRQVRGSLRRLGVETIDLYQVHFPNPLASPRATMAPLRRLLDRGSVRRIGVSNHSLGRWRASERALGQRILTNQVRFSLTSPLAHWELVPYARDEGRVVIAYSPLGQGLLGGAYSPTGPLPGDVRPDEPLLSAGQPAPARADARRAPRRGGGPRRDTRPGRTGVADRAWQRRGDPRRADARPTRGERGGRRSRPHPRGAGHPDLARGSSRRRGATTVIGQLIEAGSRSLGVLQEWSVRM